MNKKNNNRKITYKSSIDDKNIQEINNQELRKYRLSSVYGLEGIEEEIPGTNSALPQEKILDSNKKNRSTSYLPNVSNPLDKITYKNNYTNKISSVDDTGLNQGQYEGLKYISDPNIYKKHFSIQENISPGSKYFKNEEEKYVGSPVEVPEYVNYIHHNDEDKKEKKFKKLFTAKGKFASFAKHKCKKNFLLNYFTIFYKPFFTRFTKYPFFTYL
jgi:hypothetical protein